MVLIKTVEKLQQFIETQRLKSHQIGFVPTMGALHHGHISLIHQSAAANKTTVCSIFVNPAQFNEKEDYDKYPSSIEQDIDLLEQANCPVLFLPSVSEIYPNGTENLKYYPIGYIGATIEGQHRPGHYQGVCAVMDRLLNIVKPDNLYMGQKDYQQCKVIEKLLSLINNTPKIALHIVETAREPSGLAMSSRNRRLAEDDMKKAAGIFQTLSFIQNNIKPGHLGEFIKQCDAMLTLKGFLVEYIEVANAKTLRPVEQWDGIENLVALVAAQLNGIRLIDNMLIKD